MSVFDIVLLVLLGVWLAAALVFLFRRRGRGCCGCCGGCTSCSFAGTCEKSARPKGIRMKRG